MKLAPQLLPAYFWESVCVAKQGGETQAEHGDWGDRGGSLGRARWLDSAEESTEQERASQRESAGDLQRVSL